MSDHDHGATDNDGATLGFHGMVALGTRDVYLTHLAMRSGPHMFQVLCRVHFEANPQTQISGQALVAAGVTDPTEIYRQDRVHPDNPAEVYTVAPTSHFELGELAAGKLDRFGANVIRGHFERDADALTLLQEVTVIVDVLLHAHHLQVPAEGEQSPRASGSVPHLLFGSGDEFFVCHRISLHGEMGTPSDCGYHQIFPLASGSAGELAFERRDGVVEISTPVPSLAASGRLPKHGGPTSFDLSRLATLPGGSIVRDLDLGPEHYLEVLMS